MPVMKIGPAVDGGFLGIDEYLDFDLTGFAPVTDEINRQNLVFSDGTTTIRVQGLGFSVDFVGGVPVAASGTVARFIVTEGSDAILTLKGLGMTLESLLTAAAEELGGSDPFALEDLFLSSDYNWVYNGNGLSDQLLPNSVSSDGADLDLPGNDKIKLQGGDDSFAAAGGNDLLKGGNGNDTLWGEEGRDKVVGQSGDDELYGGADNDVLKGSAGNDSAYGGDGDDNVVGGGGNDMVSGDDGDDVVIGNGGSDMMFGGLGDDRLVGGGGDDTLEGGLGDDVLLGRGGADAFDFRAPAGEDPAIYDSGLDVIQGYRIGIDSVLVDDIGDWSITSRADLIVTNSQTGAEIRFDGLEIGNKLELSDIF